MGFIRMCYRYCRTLTSKIKPSFFYLQYLLKLGLQDCRPQGTPFPGCNMPRSALVSRPPNTAVLVLIAVALLASIACLAPLLGDRHMKQSVLFKQLSTSPPGPDAPPAQLPTDELLDLLPRIPRVPNSSIPMLIHQSYMNTVLPEDFVQYQKSWLKHHPEWVYQFWTDGSNRQLVQTHFPWFLDTYDNLPQKIMKPDSARYCYMFLYGGVYADLDMEALRPIGPLLQNRSAALAWMGPPDDHPHNVPNAWMASEPGHPFWLMMLLQIVQNPKTAKAEFVTGPAALKDAINRYWTPANQTGLSIIEPGLVYPLDWARSQGDIRKYCADTFGNNPDFSAARCKEVISGAYTVTYWRHSWEYSRRMLHAAAS